MYLKNIHLENVGPIKKVWYQMPFHTDNSPKPLIIVGKNGSGKSILLSHLANFLILLRSTLYENSEVETGKAYKVRSPLYIKDGTQYSYAE